MRLIDADALGIGKANRDCFDDPKYADGWNSAIEIINNAPTIEAEPVVRCKDCKWLYTGYGAYCCTKHTGLALIKPDGSDFCSNGKRKQSHLFPYQRC